MGSSHLGRQVRGGTPKYSVHDAGHGQNVEQNHVAVMILYGAEWPICRVANRHDICTVQQGVI